MKAEDGLVIIGNGVAGTTAARHLRKNDPNMRIRIISDESKYFFSRTALMYVYMGHMKLEHLKPYEDWFWEKNRIELLFDRVEGVDFDSRTLAMQSGAKLHYDHLVLATGSRPRFYNWPGQDLEGVQGLVSLQDLERLEAYTPKPEERHHTKMKAVVVGGGLIGVELAEMLTTRGVQVTMLVRDPWFWGNVLSEEEGKRITDHIREHGVKVKLSTGLQEIQGKEGRVSSVITDQGETIACDLVGITTGVQANVEFLKEKGIEIDKGFLVDENLETSIPGVYAIGDCAQMRNPRQGRRDLEPVWYVARMMGEVVGQRLAGVQTSYRPGPWFNSAKFFDIEYQVYGNLNPRPEAPETHYFWEGEKGRRFLTLAWEAETKRFLGISSFGIRLRHAFFDEHLRKESSIAEVVQEIHQANFDAEFTKKWPRQFKSDFERDTGISIPKNKLRKWLQV